LGLSKRTSVRGKKRKKNPPTFDTRGVIKVPMLKNGPYVKEFPTFVKKKRGPFQKRPSYHKSDPGSQEV